MARVVIFTSKKFEDSRGWFTEVYNKGREAAAGIVADFVQDNESFSLEEGTLRGLHFQTAPSEQAKLVRCTSGRLIDVIVDLRNGSPSFAHYVKVELSAENRRQVFVPRGFGHGFLTREPNTRIAYKVDNHYDPHCDAGIAWDSPELAIDWELGGRPPILSDKDAKLPRLADFQSPFAYDGDPLEPLYLD